MGPTTTTILNDLPNISYALLKFLLMTQNSIMRFNQNKIILQDSINNIFAWTKVWLLEFNKSKCKVLHLGKNNPNFEYYICEGSDKIKLLPDYSEKDLGVYVDPQLSFIHVHINETIKKC